MKHYAKKWSLIALVFAIVFSFVGSIPITAAGQELIKVALFIDNGNAYRNTVPTVTLSSQSGLSIGLQSINLKELSGMTSARFSVDQYYILAAETDNLTTAQQQAQKLSQAGYKPDVVVTEVNGVKHYMIRVGSYSQYTEAATTAGAVKTLTGTNAVVKGSMHITAGVYAAKDQALLALKSLRDKGFVAELALRPDAAGSKYEVLVGGEGTPVERDALKASIQQAFPTITVSDFDTTKPYLILAQDLLIGGVDNAIPHFFFGDGQIVTVASNNTSFIKVDEREGRQYRGTFQLQNHKGKMAVLNVIDAEQYLYGVVGTEMAAGWPIEALKAQAIIARSYLWAQGMKYGIANVSDTTSDQAYYGVSREAADIMKAVTETAGLVVKYNGNIFGPTFYSNAGGITADESEVWGGTFPYYQPISSPDDIAERGLLNWYGVISKSGDFGYVRSDFVSVTGQKNVLGFAYGVVNEDALNFRPAPTTDYPEIGKFAKGDQVTIVETVIQNSAYRYLSRSFTGAELAKTIGTVDTTFVDPVITSLKVDAVGPSGRVIKMSANGKNINVANPDKFRGALGGLRSTMFTIEQMGSLPVIGAGGKRGNLSDKGITVLGANGQTQTLNASDKYYAMDNKKTMKNASVIPAFRFHNKGFGHGLGMSQWGAKALAEQGYDYAKILKYYYTNGIEIAQK